MENEQIKNQTQNLLSQVKKDQQDKEFLVDRRMINQFLVTYLNKSSNRQTQTSMLQAISKILQFTEEEKATLGLGPGGAGADGQGQGEATAKRGFSASLVSFLMHDDDD